MLNEVYNRRIIELAGNIPRLGRLDTPDASATAHSKLCGSTVTVDLKMAGDEITDFAHEVKACALGQASSSIMARNIVGAKAGELRDLRDSVRKMLKENGTPPSDGRWSDIAVLEPVRDYKARHASTLLTFDAVVDAINQIEAKRRHFVQNLARAFLGELRQHLTKPGRAHVDHGFLLRLGQGRHRDPARTGPEHLGEDARGNRRMGDRFETPGNDPGGIRP